MWFKLQIEALGPLIRQALETNDTEILRGLEALDVSLWTHIHGAESVISVLVGKALERLDPSSSEFDRADKIVINPYELKRALRGLSRRRITHFLAGLIRLGLLDEKYDRETGRLLGYSLSSVWNARINDMRERGKEAAVFTSAMGRLLGLSLIGQGVSSFRPIMVALSYAEKNDSKISVVEMRRIYVGSEGGRLAERKFYEMTRRDNKKDPEIRLIASNDGKTIIFNEPVLRVHRLLNEIALSRFHAITGA